MENKAYVSCIKINGVPILPPMLTKDIKEEMAYYKQLAIMVENRLSSVRVAKQSRVNQNVSHDRESHDTLTEKLDDLDNDRPSSDIQSTDCSPDVTTITTLSKAHKSHDGYDDSPNNSLDISRRNSRDNNAVENPQKENTTEDLSGQEGETRPSERVASRSDSVSTSVDLSQCYNESSNTTESTPEIWRPQVPKTLDIVPLTLVTPEKCSTDEPEIASDTPKMIRQGSYVLDNPSPVLLAHMQTELEGCPDREGYVPTATSTSSGIKRKEWNIAQAKIEWQHQGRSNEIFPLESNGHFARPCASPRVCAIDSVSPQTKRKTPRLGTYSSARSVDCIQAMLAKEYVARNNLRNTREQRHGLENNPTEEKPHRFEKWKRRGGGISILSLAQKLGGSLGSLNSIAAPFHKCMEGERREENPTREDRTEKISENGEPEDTTCKSKSSVTSNKLLIVYKEIQKMHRKQMAELVNRQHREQNLLQREFEKQQLLLLNEIRKSFPEASASLNRLISDNERHSESYEIPRENGKEEIEDFHERKEEYTRENGGDRIPCPLDYIYPETNYYNSEERRAKCSQSYSQSTQTFEEVPPNCTRNRGSLGNRVTEEQEVGRGNETKMNGEHKRLNVSRQLFPLDCKTVHVPVLDGTLYEAKHIRAASIINAYARGYLVRRMMKTERVRALKNTYKEALHCMLKLHVDAPLNRSEFNFLHRLQLQCDAASMNITELFSQSPAKRMEIIAQDRDIKRARTERPTSARSYSFATQRTLARKKLKEMGEYQPPSLSRSSSSSRSRCQTWTSDVKEKLISPNLLHQSIKRSTSAGTVRKPWR